MQMSIYHIDTLIETVQRHKRKFVNNNDDSQKPNQNKY